MGAPGVVITKSAPPRGKGCNGKGVGLTKAPPQVPPGTGFGTSTSSTAPALSTDEVASKRLQQLAEKDFHNYVCFLTTTIQAVKRTVLARAGEGKIFSLRELPGAFEQQWGTAFEKSRLGLQDLADLGSLLQLFPTCFFVDMADSLGPTLSVLPGGPALRPPPEEVARMLWRRSRELQGKHVEDSLGIYQAARRKAQQPIFEEATAAAEKRREQEKAEAEAKAAKEAKAKAKPLPPWRMTSASTTAPNDAGSVSASEAASPRGEKRPLPSSGTGGQSGQAYSKASLGSSETAAAPPPPPPPPKSVAFGGEAVHQSKGHPGWAPPPKIVKTKPQPPPAPLNHGQAGSHANDTGDTDDVLRDQELQKLKREEEEIQKKQAQVQVQTQQLGYEQQQLLFQLQQVQQAPSPDNRTAQADMQQRLNSMLLTAASLQEEERQLSAQKQQLEARRSELMPATAAPAAGAAAPAPAPPPPPPPAQSPRTGQPPVTPGAPPPPPPQGPQLSPEQAKLRQEKQAKQAQLQQDILQRQLQISALQTELSQLFVLQQEVGQQLQLAAAQPGVSVYALQHQYKSIQQKSATMQRQQQALLVKQEACSKECNELVQELSQPLHVWLESQAGAAEAPSAVPPTGAAPSAAHAATASPTVAAPAKAPAPPALPAQSRGSSASSTLGPGPPNTATGTTATIATTTTAEDPWSAKRESLKTSANEARQRLEEQQKQQMQQLEKQHQAQRDQLSQQLIPTTSPYPQQQYLLQQQHQKKMLQLQQLERSQLQQREEFRLQLEAQRAEQDKLLEKQLKAFEEAAVAAGAGGPSAS